MPKTQYFTKIHYNLTLFFLCLPYVDESHIFSKNIKEYQRISKNINEYQKGEISAIVEQYTPVSSKIIYIMVKSSSHSI